MSPVSKLPFDNGENFTESLKKALNCIYLFVRNVENNFLNCMLYQSILWSLWSYCGHYRKSILVITENQAYRFCTMCRFQGESKLLGTRLHLIADSKTRGGGVMTVLLDTFADFVEICAILSENACELALSRHLCRYSFFSRLLCILFRNEFSHFQFFRAVLQIFASLCDR